MNICFFLIYFIIYVINIIFSKIYTNCIIHSCYNRRFASFCIKTIDFFEFYDYNYEYKKRKTFEASFFPLLPVIM